VCTRIHKYARARSFPQSLKGDLHKCRVLLISVRAAAKGKKNVRLADGHTNEPGLTCQTRRSFFLDIGAYQI